MKTKTIALLLAVALVFGGVVGGTIAWLTDKTDEVKNTFTTSDIEVTLAETKPTNQTAQMVPGTTIEKDPKVTVTNKTDVDIYLFVKVEEQNWPAYTEEDGETRKVNYAIADGWKELTEGSGIYYRVVLTTDATKEFAVLANNQVTVSSTMTKEDMEDIDTDPTLTFTAYAIQTEGFADAAAAWAEVSK